MERRFENPGHNPRRWPPDTLVWVTWANGQDSKQPYRVDGLRWSITNQDYDIRQFWRVT